MQLKPIPFRSLEDFVTMGQILSSSRMFGDINPSVGTVIAMTCYQKNWAYDDFIRQYDINTQGKLTTKAHAMLAKFQLLGGVYTIVERTNDRCEIVFSFGSNKDQHFALTIQEAHESGITQGKNGTKDTWKKHPKAMLFARVISDALKAVCPQVAAGIYTPEEASDFTPAETAIDFDDVSVSTAQNYDDYATPAPAPLVVSNPAVCPWDGEWKNRRWEEMPDEMLTVARDYAGTPEACKQIIVDILNARTQEAQ